jgi:fructose-1,6-bisphosphatase/inositol monophosphatase family enzyme
MLRNLDELTRRLRAVHEAIRDEVLAVCESSDTDSLSRVVGDDAGDTIFAIDRVSETALLEHFAPIARDYPCLLVAEGLGNDGRQILPQGAAWDELEMVVLVDPIDGTRGLMYQKRSAWILTGVAPLEPGRAPTLADIELAVQTEIPLVKQHLTDALWATKGGGAYAERYDRITKERRPLRLAPSRATTIAQGFGCVARFFPGARDELGAIDDSVVDKVLGPPEAGRAQAFEDQYISTGGQLYELVIGHDRWMADLRPLLDPLLEQRGRPRGMCCHPYDLSTELIAREAGVTVTAPSGDQLTAPLDVSTNVAWLGFANRALADQVGPALREILRERRLL